LSLFESELLKSYLLKKIRETNIKEEAELKVLHTNLGKISLVS